MGHVCALWLWSIDNAPDGDLSDMDVKDIACAALWDGDPDKLLAALRGAKFIDEGTQIHGWAEYTDKLMAVTKARREGNRERQRRFRERKKSCDDGGTACGTLDGGAAHAAYAAPAVTGAHAAYAVTGAHAVTAAPAVTEREWGIMQSPVTRSLQGEQREALRSAHEDAHAERYNRDNLDNRDNCDNHDNIDNHDYRDNCDMPHYVSHDETRDAVTHNGTTVPTVPNITVPTVPNQTEPTVPTVPNQTEPKRNGDTERANARARARSAPNGATRPAPSAERSHAHEGSAHEGSAHEGSAPDGATRPAPSAERSHAPNKPAKLVFGTFGNVMLTNDERRLLDEKLGVPTCVALIEQLSGYIASKGAKYKSHYATLIQWHARAANAQQSPPQTTHGTAAPNQTGGTTNPFLKILEDMGDE
jgi:hypothetical protein